MSARAVFVCFVQLFNWVVEHVLRSQVAETLTPLPDEFLLQGVFAFFHWARAVLG